MTSNGALVVAAVACLIGAIANAVLFYLTASVIELGLALVSAGIAVYAFAVWLAIRRQPPRRGDPRWN